MIIHQSLPMPPGTERAAWRRMIRFDSVSADPFYFSAEDAAYQPHKRVFAEGDSWFDKFTPMPVSGANLLDAIRTPWHTAVFDVSQVGDLSADIATGWQARRTRELFRLFDFDLILLSTGGNDLKNLYATKLAGLAAGGLTDAEIASLLHPGSYAAEFDQVLAHIGAFVALRDTAASAATRKAPILINGYDYFQPRAAGAPWFRGGRLGSGPWVFPVLRDAGLTAAQMREAAAAVIDCFHERLIAAFGGCSDIHVVDSRSVLSPAHPASTGEYGDWLDEIHPSKAGFEKLADCRWSRAVAHHLHQAARIDGRPPR